VANSFEHGKEASDSTVGVECFYPAVRFLIFRVGNRCNWEVIRILTSFSDLESAENGGRRIPETF
jgi:hypothetical protein